MAWSEQYLLPIHNCFVWMMPYGILLLIPLIFWGKFGKIWEGRPTPGVDPGFPTGRFPKAGCQPIIQPNFPKLYKNEENWAEGRCIRNLSTSIHHWTSTVSCRSLHLVPFYQKCPLKILYLQVGLGIFPFWCRVQWFIHSFLTRSMYGISVKFINLCKVAQKTCQSS